MPKKQEGRLRASLLPLINSSPTASLVLLYSQLYQLLSLFLFIRPTMTSLPSSLVQTNSVQSQFVALSRDRDNFRHAMEAAERDRRMAESQLQQLKSTTLDLQREIRSAQEELGTVSRKQHLVKQEQARLQRVLELERKALEDCARHANSMVEQEVQRKKAYCSQLEPLNDNLADVLDREAGSRFSMLLNVESVEAVWNKIPIPESVDRQALEEGYDLLKEARDKSEREEQRRSRCATKLEEVRARGKQMHPEITDWDDKEKLSVKEHFSHFMINDDHSEASEKDPQHQNMDFFYGSEEPLVDMEVQVEG
jgi:chromosome segregation ATPase